MKKVLLLLSFFISIWYTNAQLTPPDNLKDYYKDVDFSLTGTALFNDLATETIAKHSNILEYFERHNYLYNADADLLNSNNVILMYSSESRDEREYLSGSNSHSPQTFNTEHVYPQSLIGNTARGDLHHLRACDVSINSSRGSRKFTESSGTYGTVGSSWYPGDEWKGDVARMIMYLNLRYNESFTDIGTLNLFLKWNVEDPVSDFEKNRNEVITNAQGNRNPFIDNPYLATIIWGGSAAENRWATLSAENNNLDVVKVFPNPITGNQLFITTKESTKLIIYNVLGKQILRASINAFSKKSINVESLNPGIYILKLSIGNKSITKKLIKR